MPRPGRTSSPPWRPASSPATGGPCRLLRDAPADGHMDPGRRGPPPGGPDGFGEEDLAFIRDRINGRAALYGPARLAPGGLLSIPGPRGDIQVEFRTLAEATIRHIQALASRPGPASAGGPVIVPASTRQAIPDWPGASQATPGRRGLLFPPPIPRPAPRRRPRRGRHQPADPLGPLQFAIDQMRGSLTDEGASGLLHERLDAIQAELGRLRQAGVVRGTGRARGPRAWLDAMNRSARLRGAWRDASRDVGGLRGNRAWQALGHAITAAFRLARDAWRGTLELARRSASWALRLWNRTWDRICETASDFADGIMHRATPGQPDLAGGPAHAPRVDAGARALPRVPGARPSAPDGKLRASRPAGAGAGLGEGPGRACPGSPGSRNRPASWPCLGILPARAERGPLPARVPGKEAGGPPHGPLPAAGLSREGARRPR